MKPTTGMALATAAFVGALAFGGVQLASAQEDTTTTTPEDSPTSDRDTSRDHDCPEKDSTSESSDTSAS